MPQRPLFDPAAFRLAEGVSHVCAGGEPLWLLANDDALRQYGIDKGIGMPGRTRMEAQVERARALIAKPWGCDPGDIGFVSSVADGVAMVADSLDWHEGDEVVVDAHEYPSVVMPFGLRRTPRLTLRVATGMAPGRLEALVTPRTRVIGVSAVSYLTGEKYDLASLREAADKVGALLVVDFTQMAGNQAIPAALADFGFSACYKWLLGITGVAVAYWNRTRQPGWAPPTGGWHSLAPVPRPDYAAGVALRPDALRFTRGNPAHGPVYVLATALDYLASHDAQATAAHIAALSADLLARLAEAGIPATTPPDPARHAANVCIDSPHAQAWTDSLYRQGIWAWNGHGRIRFSFHGYNSTGDVDRIAIGMRQLWQG
ncbi:MAG: aminotransferase class V-fold PLP-dependent enzyme [Acetobacteraceae bacterium]|nr:aminotransferase class V-fold PLP-dependent enzyme [Acetobacteraceae bacterium]